MLATSVVVSCDDPPTGSLTLIHNEAAIVVPGSASNCTDIRTGSPPIPQSLATDFFKLSTFKLKWDGTNELAQGFLRITISHPFLQGSPVKCEISGTDFDDTFGPGPYAAGTTIDMNDPLLAPNCALGCGGLKRVAGHETSVFSTTANIEFIGYSQNTDGSDPKPVRANSQLRLSFY